MSDDHAYQAISAYGHELNDTPNIDRIANEGALFDKGFVTNSICAPSRAVMLTGKHSFINGKVDNIQDFNWNQDNFAKQLQTAGYQTAMIGKIHLRGLPQGFDYSAVLPGQGHYYNPDFLINGIKKRIEGYVTTITTELSLDWLKNKRDPTKPFLLLYHQKAPHRNWKPEEKYLTLFDDKTFDPPTNFFDDYSNRGTAAKTQEMLIAATEEQIEVAHGNGGHGRWGHDFKMRTDPYGNTTGFEKELERFSPDQKTAWLNAYTPKNEAMKAQNLEGRDLALWKFNRYLKDYLRTIQSVDDSVGDVLDYLDQEGLTENTIVVYTSDQGFYLGEHGWFDKRFMYEEALRMPFIIRYPGKIKPGIVVDDIITNIDFAPTLLEMAGVSVPEAVQGKSFFNNLKGKTAKDWRQSMYYHYYEYPYYHRVQPHYGIRNQRYKLIHFYYDIDVWEFYDLQNDPTEMNNLIHSEAYAERIENMKTELYHLKKGYGNTMSLTELKSISDTDFGGLESKKK